MRRTTRTLSLPCYSTTSSGHFYRIRIRRVTMFSRQNVMWLLGVNAARLRRSLHASRVLQRSAVERLEPLKAVGCHELRPSHVGQKVVISGWLQFNRAGKFLILRDGIGSAQIMIPEVCDLVYL